jgi:hypothetical protein
VHPCVCHFTSHTQLACIKEAGCPACKLKCVCVCVCVCVFLLPVLSFLYMYGHALEFIIFVLYSVLGYINFFALLVIKGSQWYYYPHFTDEETETQKG